MKAKYYMLIAAAVLAAAASCTREISPEPSLGEEFVFKATLEQEEDDPATRTQLGAEGAVLWSPADEVSIFLGSGSNGGSKFTSKNTEPAKTVEFKGYLSGLGTLPSGQYWWALYPYSEDNTCNGRSITSTLPSEQTAVKGSFGKRCHPAIARSTDTGLAFYAVAGGVEFTVTRPGVRSVSIKSNGSEAIAGSYTASFGADGRPSVQVTGTQTEVTLAAPGGSAFIPGEHYALSLLPGRLGSGVTITIITDDNKKGTIVSGKPQTVKRSVFGRISKLDELVENWEDIPADTEGGGTRTGLYIGIIGFNQELYKKGIEKLDDTSKGRFDSFIDGLTTKNGTLLYYSVDEAIRTLQKASYPEDLFSVSLITFTDGLDQGSSMMIDDYPGDGEYLDILHDRLSGSSVAGLPLSAYSVGLKGSDVTNVDKFRSNLKNLASPASNAYEVTNISAVNTRFQEIANQVTQTTRTTRYSLKFSIPGQANGTRMRFTLDGASSAVNSSMYIEGVFNLANKSLTDVTYHGISCLNGSTVAGEVSGIFVSFFFEDVVPDGNATISQANVRHWTYVSSTGNWRKNSEFDTANDVNVTETTVKKSAVVLLNLDCSKSLGSQFTTLQSHAKSFISKLYSSAVDPSEVSGVSLDNTELTIYKGTCFPLVATVTPSTAADKSVRWTSSNSAVATVDQNGKVTGINEGVATITATTVDGGYYAECEVTVLSMPDSIKAVDLGLSVPWATCNVGASEPEEYGAYFAWGETKPKSDYSGETYKWCNGDYQELTKYCPSDKTSYWAGSGSPDGKTVLDPEDDAARVNWGGSWRMPTDAEWTELRNNCTWTWTDDYNGTGKKGYIVTSKIFGYTDKSIFLPAAGYIYYGDLYRVGSYGIYWSSSLDTDGPVCAWNVKFYSGSVRRDESYRVDCRSVRPVGCIVRLDRSLVALLPGKTIQLTSTVSPDNITVKTVTWTSSNTSVAAVNQEGLVTSHQEGTAIISVTVTTQDEKLTATCTVEVKGILGEAVDLGLSVKWATCNVGAFKPEEYGAYFAWGETEPKSEYKWANYLYGTSKNGPFSEYVLDADYGTVDYKTVLDLDDDAAHSNWGGDWRMPTKEEVEELITNCTWTWTSRNGVNGYEVSRNGNSIFLPANGMRTGASVSDVGTIGNYWASSVSGDGTYCSISPYFSQSYKKTGNCYRYFGLGVRPVYGAVVPVSKITLSETLTLIEGKKESATLSATVLPDNATYKNITWASSDESVATVNASGKVTAVAPGSATITVYSADGMISAQCKVDVNQLTQSITLDKKSIEIYVGDEPVALTATVLPEENTDKVLNWTSSNTSVATVDKDGRVKAVSSGSATITAMACDGSGKKASCSATVYSHVESITLDKTELIINIGTSSTLSATILPASSNKAVLWESSDESVATVDQSGKVTSVSTGDAVITATTVDGCKTARCKVTVIRPVTSITLDKTAFEIYVGDAPAELVATVLPEDATNKRLSWTSSNTSVATVDEDGRVTAVSAGSATITATASDGSGKNASCNVIVYPDLSRPDLEEAVDLGLSVKWATCNVGASKPEGYGAYFAWGETKPKSDYSWSTYKWSESSSSTPRLTKYCPSKVAANWGGSGDRKNVLDLDDDAARVNWGGSWRMPTDSEWGELINNSTWTWTDDYNGTGIKGYIVTSKKTGYTNKSIFLPAEGYRSGTDLCNVGSSGYYWSSSLSSYYPFYAWCVYFRSDAVFRSDDHYGRCIGQSVRPITE